VANNDPSAHAATEFLINAITEKLQLHISNVLEKVSVIRFLKTCVEKGKIDD